MMRILYNQVPHLTQDTVWESDKTQLNLTYKRAKRSAFFQQVTTSLQEKYTKVWERQTQITKKIHKRSTTLERSERKYITGRLKHVSRYQPHP